MRVVNLHVAGRAIYYEGTLVAIHVHVFLFTQVLRPAAATVAVLIVVRELNFLFEN